MIKGIKSIWLALSDDATPVCCEPDRIPGDNPTKVMSLELLEHIGQVVAQNDWSCHISTNHNALLPAYADICRCIGTELIVPNNYEGEPIGIPMTVVIDQNSEISLGKHITPNRAILRVKRAAIGNLASQVQALFGYVSDISIFHPELLQYSDSDMQLYQKEIEQVGFWLLTKGNPWISLRLNCLTDGILGINSGACDAGICHLTVGPDGQTYICPAYLHTDQRLGVLWEESNLPDRHLLTRAYSLICKACSVDNCLRCIYLNKTSTHEYCVSAANVCKLAHMEQRARAAIAQELRNRGEWNTDWNDPVYPEILDPFEALAYRRVESLTLWQHRGLTAMHLVETNSRMMLHIILELQGIVRAVNRCVQEGVDIPYEYLLSDTAFTRIRAWTPDTYRNIRIKSDSPTIREIEWAIISGKSKQRDEINTRSEP